MHLAQEAAGLVRVLFGDESGFTENPPLTQAWGNALAAKCNPSVPTHLWLDNGPIHKAKATLALFPEWVAKGLHIHFLSPYSPELNRIEILWRKMKRLRPFILLEIKALRISLRKILTSLSRKSQASFTYPKGPKACSIC